MKSLDEVVKAMECCEDYDNAECEKCPYASLGIMCCSKKNADALHYLREYKAHQADWSYAVANSEQFAEARDKHIKALAELKRNDPLSWDELKQMEGKPVWIEYNFRIGDKEFRNNSKRWCVIREFKPWHDTEIIITDNGLVLSKNEQVKGWQAYRKERG